MSRSYNTYDAISQKDGPLGIAQILVIATGFLIMFCGGWQSLLTVFAARDVSFYCLDTEPPAITNHTMSDDEIGNDSRIGNDVIIGNDCLLNCAEFVYQSEVSSIKSFSSYADKAPIRKSTNYSAVL